MNPAGKLATVGVSNRTIAFADTYTPAWKIVLLASTKGPFPGQTYTIHMSLAPLLGSCTAGNPLTTFAIQGTVTSP